MHQEITRIPVRPWMLNGLSERLIVSHYENKLRRHEVLTHSLALFEGLYVGASRKE